MCLRTEVRERPILFSGPMVNSILAGRKTQTRRIVKFGKNKPNFCASWVGWTDHYEYGPGWYAQDVDQPYGELAEMLDEIKLTGPFGEVGSHLYVKETWRTSAVSDDTKPSLLFDGADRIWYEADGYRDHLAGKVRQSIFMPRWASRLTLEITDIRVERIQDISHEDALAEGCTGYNWVASSPYISGPHTDDGELPVEEYERLWESLHGSGSWAKNEWVWVISFKRIDPRRN